MKSKEYIDSILSDQEKDAIAAFTQNEVLVEAVKKVLLVGIYGNGTLKKGEAADPLRNFAFGAVFNRPDISNEHIGEELRAAMSGINTLETAFQNLLAYKPVPVTLPPKKNSAR